MSVPPPQWWAMHAVQVLVLCTAVALALAAARRIGGHTPYATLLFLLGVGFWFLLLGELVFLGRNALGAWQGPGGLTDVLQLGGWALLVASVALFVTRFMPHPSTARQRWALALYVLLPVAVVLVGFQWLSPPGADPEAWVRVPYLVLDAAGVGLVAGGLDRFVRLRHTALGRLYVLLGTAVLLKTMGDVYWAYLAARGASSLVATLFYPLAGLVAVAGLAWHHGDLGRERLHGSPVGTPWMRPEQQRLRDLAQALADAAGASAGRTALRAAARAFEERGLEHSVRGGLLEGIAGDDVWQDAVARAHDYAVAHFGAAGRRAVEAAP